MDQQLATQKLDRFHRCVIRKINVVDVADLGCTAEAERGAADLQGRSVSGKRRKESVGITSAVGTEAMGALAF
jgi:hypothetical protein